MTSLLIDVSSRRAVSFRRRRRVFCRWCIRARFATAPNKNPFGCRALDQAPSVLRSRSAKVSATTSAATDRGTSAVAKRTRSSAYRSYASWRDTSLTPQRCHRTNFWVTQSQNSSTPHPTALAKQLLREFLQGSPGATAGEVEARNGIPFCADPGAVRTRRRPTPRRGRLGRGAMPQCSPGSRSHSGRGVRRRVLRRAGRAARATRD